MKKIRDILAAIRIPGFHASTLIILPLICIPLIGHAQCFEIESILVDACDGSNEGKNEMVTFKVGNTALNTANLTVSWPNNSWQGICQDAGTASSVASINSTIMGCGYLKEPVGGILPAHARVLLITSTAFNPSAQSFVNLSDTLIVIFQCAGNTAGHFANFGSGTRSMSMSFSSPASCTDAVTYDRSMLLTQALTVGGQDGGAVEFDAAGNARYVNHGCQAPFVPLSVNAGPDKSVCFNTQAVLTATASGSYNTLAWSGGAGIFSNPSSLTTTYTPGIGETGIIKLYCQLIKSCGTQTLTVKDSVNITILQLPQANISASNGYSICPSANSVISYTLSNAAFSGTVSPNWSSPTSTLHTYTVTPGSGPTVYTLSLTNSCGSSDQTFTITPLTLPSVSLSAHTFTVCPGATVSVSATANPANYTWTYPAGVSTSSVSFTASTTTVGIVTTTNSCGSASDSYSLTVMPAASVSITPSNLTLCNGQSATIVASSNAPGTYTWSTGANANTISVNSQGVRTVSVSNVCGVASASINVIVSSVSSISVIATPSAICSGQSSTLSITGSTGTYSWSTGVSSQTISVNTSGLYTATVSGTCGTGSASVSINQLPAPMVSISPSTVSLCGAQSITITPSTSNVNTYTWSTGANTPTIAVNTTGIRTLTVSNSCGSATASVQVITGQAPSLTLTATSTIVCPNGTVTLTVNGGSSPYTWSHTTSTGSTTAAGPGSYTVSSTNACGTGTVSMTITQYTIDADLTLDPSSGVIPLTVSFNNNSIGANTFAWDFDNGNTSGSQNPGPETYTNPGTYTVVLTASNGTCTVYDTALIYVLETQPWLTIPNVFTPNQDHVNDVFYISGANITTFRCAIYNRWGNLLYTISDLKSGWDGTISGQDASEGTYFYMIEAKDIFDKKIEEKGHFLLIR